MDTAVTDLISISFLQYRNPFPGTDIERNCFEALCSLFKRDGRTETFAGINEVGSYFRLDVL